MPDFKNVLSARLSNTSLPRLSALAASLILLTSCGEATTEALAADILIEQHKYDAAIKEADRAITISPKSAQLYWARGYSYLQLGQASRAIEDLTKAIDMSKAENNVKEIYYWSRAMAYQDTGKHDEAIADCNAALALAPKHPDAHVYLVRGYSEGRKGQHDQQIADYSQAIERSKTPITYLYRAAAYDSQGKHDLGKADRDSSDKLSGTTPPNPTPMEKKQLDSGG